MTLRAGTSDLEVVRQVLRDRGYQLTGPHGDRIKVRYEQMLAAGQTPVVVDAGANMGAASIWFALHYPRAVVIAIEPEASNAELCRRNTEGRQVRVVEAALGSEPGHVTLGSEAIEKWAVTTERSADGAVSVLTMQQVLSLEPNGALLIVKVDVEGIEEDVFSSNTDWVDQAEAVFVEPHDWLFAFRGSSDALRRRTAELESDLLIRGESLVFVRRPPIGP